MDEITDMRRSKRERSDIVAWLKEESYAWQTLGRETGDQCSLAVAENLYIYAIRIRQGDHQSNRIKT